jgi:hypothetical protein
MSSFLRQIPIPAQTSSFPIHLLNLAYFSILHPLSSLYISIPPHSHLLPLTFLASPIASKSQPSLRRLSVLLFHITNSTLAHPVNMRLYHLVALLAVCLVAAEEQQPLMDVLKGYFNKISSLVPTSVPKVVETTPLEATAAKVANLAVTNLNMTNWKDVLTPAKTVGESDEWLVYINGNKSCQGLCDNTTKAWNVSQPPSAAIASKHPSANQHL